MIDAGRVRTVLGCRNPDRQVSAAGRSELLPRPFGVGEPVAYVQAPKAKGHRSLSIGFRTPRPRVLGQFAGAHRKRFFPIPFEEMGMGIAIHNMRPLPTVRHQLTVQGDCLFRRRHPSDSGEFQSRSDTPTVFHDNSFATYNRQISFLSIERN